MYEVNKWRRYSTASHNSEKPFLHLDNNYATQSETFEKVVNILYIYVSASNGMWCNEMYLGSYCICVLKVLTCEKAVIDVWQF